MGELWEWENEGLGEFGSFQAMDFGKTLVISFWFLPLVLGVQGYGIKRRNKI